MPSLKPLAGLAKLVTMVRMAFELFVFLFVSSHLS